MTPTIEEADVSVGMPELVVLLIVAMGIGLTTLVVVIVAMTVLRQRGAKQVPPPRASPADPPPVDPPLDPPPPRD